MRFIFSILIIFTAISCSDKGTYMVSVDFRDSVSLQGEILPTEILSANPNNMILIDSTLLLFRPGGCVAKMVSIKDGSETGVFGAIGRGPYEFISPHFAGWSDKDSVLYIHDISTKLMSEYKLSNKKLHPLSNKQISADSVILTRGLKLSNGFYLFQTVFAKDNLLLLMDSNLNVTSRFFNPIKGEVKNLRLISGDFTSYEDKFVFACNDIGYIACYQVTIEGTPKLLWEHFISEPKFITDKYLQINHKENLPGFYDVKMTKDYIFAAYSGKKYTLDKDGYPYGRAHVPETILVFDHKGNPVKKIKLSHDTGNIAISQNLDYIYTFNSIENRIIKYDIKKRL